jgi:hypothetical protein
MELDRGAGSPARGAASSVAPCARPPRGRLAFSMRRTGARPSLSQYTYRIPVSATVAPMICARGCVPERCFIRVRALERYRAGLTYLAPAV